MEAPPGSAVQDRDGLRGLVVVLRERGDTVIGPTVRDQATTLDELTSVDDPPAGWTDGQEGGRHRLRRRDDAALFGHAAGPHSWKRFLLPPGTFLWRASRRGDGMEVSEDLCERDPRSGCRLTPRLAEVMLPRMQLARLRLSDLYGHADAN